jgi:hypothetical protein
MRIGPHLFVILAAGALSTNAAVAAYHGHHAHGAATAVDRGHRQAATTSTGPGGWQGAAIDTRITVYQGREASDKTKVRPVKKATIAGAPLAGRNVEHVHNRDLAPPAGSDGSLRRNAVGAIVEPAKPADHGVDTVRGAAAPPTAVVTRGLDAKPVIGNASIGKLSAGTPPAGDHGAGAAAVTVVRMNGPSISGTGLTRPGSGTSVIGGPAKIAAGAIGGNSFRPKHP